MNTFKSIGAVVGGFVTVFVLSVVADMVMEKTGIFPPQDQISGYTNMMFVYALLYRSLFTLLGGYITARLAPQNPMKHVTVLGIIGSIGALIGIFVGWSLGFHWYCISLFVTAFPLVWLGGKLYYAQKQS